MGKTGKQAKNQIWLKKTIREPKPLCGHSYSYSDVRFCSHTLPKSLVMLERNQKMKWCPRQCHQREWEQVSGWVNVCMYLCVYVPMHRHLRLCS